MKKASITAEKEQGIEANPNRPPMPRGPGESSNKSILGYA